MDNITRKEVFRALVGSHNYNLQGEGSDKDYKIFVAPSFDDLYNNEQYSKSIIGEDIDLDIHDIRKIPRLFYKSNVNFLEVLFSEEIKVDDSEINVLINQIFAMKNEVARMNLPYLYNACIGMYITKMKLLEKGTEGTKHLVDKYGYDTKQALHAFRILDFLRRYALYGFTDFKKAIWYGNGEPTKQFLMNLKNGHFALEEFRTIAQDLFEDTEAHYSELYKRQEVDEDTYNKLSEIIRNIVQLYLNKELASKNTYKQEFR